MHKLFRISGIKYLSTILFFCISFFIASSNQILAQKVMLGIDVLERDQFSMLNGKRVGLITNHTGVNSKLLSTHDLFKLAKNFKLAYMRFITFFNNITFNSVAA